MARHCPQGREPRLHERHQRRVRRHRLLRLALRLYRRGRLRDFRSGAGRGDGGARAARRAGGEADRARRARFAPAGSRASALRPRPRRDHLAGRGRPRLSPFAKSRRPSGGFLGRRSAFCANSRTARRASASASGPTGRAPVREGAEILAPDGSEDRRSSPPAASARPSNAPVAMGYVDTSLRRAGHRGHDQRPARQRAGESSPRALRPTPLRPRKELNRMPADHALHQGP